MTENACFEESIKDVPLFRSVDVNDQQVEKTMDDLPDEILLSIFQHLENQDIVSRIAKVCLKWEKLASDSELWRNRYLFYNFNKCDEFNATVRTINNMINYIHLGGHQAMEEEALQALLCSNITVVKKLSFLGSCRTNPSKVIKILQKFGANLESLTLCVNNELVSFGTDEKTCYALKDAHLRPGIIFNLIGCMENLKNLTLYGGFCTKWYFGELLQSPGCSKIETLDLKDFEEFSDNFRSSRKLDLVQTLVLKNKDHLRLIKLSLSGASSSGVRRCVHKCYKSLKNLSINLKQLNEFHTGSLSLDFLELNGRFLHDRQLESMAHSTNISLYGHLLHGLTEFNFIQFDIIEKDMFGQLAKFLLGLKILRLEGNWLTSENINIIINSSPFLENICVRSSQMVVEKHLISICIQPSILQNVDFDDTCEMDCATNFEIMSFLNYSIIQTGCECDINSHGHGEFKSGLASVALSSNCCTSRAIHLTISNNLDVEFLPKFCKFSENDRIFHFEL